jgi:hypothetical protein
MRLSWLRPGKLYRRWRAALMVSPRRPMLAAISRHVFTFQR